MSNEFDDTYLVESDDYEQRLYTDWNIENEGRAWRGTEAQDKFQRTPERIEMIDGKLFWTEEDRLNMLALLLENVGADRAVQFGDPEVWRRAVSKLTERAG